jgi:predicted metal-dependent hydrolase
VLHVPGGAAGLPPRVGAFLKDAARRGCAGAVARHAARLGRAPRRLTLRDPRSRWGSCTSEGDLMFSWRLAMAPSAVLDYVVAHEVAHLAELNHSPRFWAEVRRLCPDFEAQRAWLRRHGAGLHAFDFASASA